MAHPSEQHLPLRSRLAMVGEMRCFPGVPVRPGALGRCRRGRVRSLTMVEAVAVLAVIAVLAAVAIRGVRSTGATLTAETSLLASRLRYVHALALAGGTQHIWGLQIETNRYWLARDGAQPSGINLPGTNSPAYAFPSGIRVSSGTGLVAFDAWGSPGATDTVVTVTDGSTTQSLTVTAVTGFVR